MMTPVTNLSCSLNIILLLYFHNMPQYIPQKSEVSYLTFIIWCCARFWLNLAIDRIRIAFWHGTLTISSPQVFRNVIYSFDGRAEFSASFSIHSSF